MGGHRRNDCVPNIADRPEFKVVLMDRELELKLAIRIPAVAVTAVEILPHRARHFARVAGGISWSSGELVPKARIVAEFLRPALAPRVVMGTVEAVAVALHVIVPGRRRELVLAGTGAVAPALPPVLAAVGMTRAIRGRFAARPAGRGRGRGAGIGDAGGKCQDRCDENRPFPQPPLEFRPLTVQSLEPLNRASHFHRCPRLEHP